MYLYVYVSGTHTIICMYNDGCSYYLRPKKSFHVRDMYNIRVYVVHGPLALAQGNEPIKDIRHDNIFEI